MILITGHRGFIGTKLSEKIPNFIGIDKKEANNLLYCDLPDNIDVIYHLASQTSVEDSWNNPTADSFNIQMTLRLIEKYPKAKIIFTQSASSLDITSPYGLSKKTCEEYLKLLHKNTVVLVLPNVYGGGKGIVDIIKNNKDITIYGDGTQSRDFVHVDDIVNALLLAQKWDIGRYMCGSGIKTRIIDLLENKVVNFAPKRQEIYESVLENTTPNWRPLINVKDYVK